MVKAPSASTFQSKFKPWRKGKSSKGKHAGKTTNTSLKQQLRGLLRLRDKNPTSLKEETQTRIEALQAQIEERQNTEKERTNATKSHKVRFMERQKSMRRYKKLMNESPRDEQELYKLALDQMYIAHYPLADTSYLSLYTVSSKDKNITRRTVLNARLLFKMAQQRKLALEKSRTEDTVSWVPLDQYERVKHLKDWSTELERSTFGIQEAKKEDKNHSTLGEDDIPKDDRFQVSDQHAELLQEAADIEKHLESDAEEDGTDENDGASSDDDDDSSSSSDDSSSSSSSSESASSNDDEQDEPTEANQRTAASLVADGFLTADTTTTSDVFDNAKRQEPRADAKGDKSKGWATQRQLPGEFRKRRKR